MKLNDIPDLNVLLITDRQTIVKIEITISVIYCNAFFSLNWSEQTWQTCYLLVQMAIYWW